MISRTGVTDAADVLFTIVDYGIAHGIVVATYVATDGAIDSAFAVAWCVAIYMTTVLLYDSR